MKSNYRPRQSLWVMRIYYMFFIGGDGFLTFLNLFFIRLGLQGEQIGFLATITSIVTLIIAPLSGALSSKTGKPIKILQFGLFGTGLLILLMSQQKIFGWIALITALRAALFSGIEPISSDLAIRIAEKDSRAGFGSIRLWGAVGWGCLTFLAGYLVERFSMLVMFIGYGTAMLISASILYFLHGDSVKEATETQAVKVTQALKVILKDWAMIGLGLSLILNWGSWLGIFHFEPIYMDQLGASETLIGFTITLGALVEIPFMLWADKLLKKWDPVRIIQIAFLMDICRVAVMLAAPTIISILFIRVIDGISYAFFAVAVVLFISRRAPAGQNATLQAVFLVTLVNFMTIFTAPLIGRVFDSMGAYTIYQIAFVGMTAGLLVFWITNRKPKSPAGSDP